MGSRYLSHIAAELDGLKAAGLYKAERVITSQQAGAIQVAGGRQVLNFCANNYLGLADSPELTEAAQAALDRYGYGMASVRFICGTQEEHKALEARIAGFLGMRGHHSLLAPASTPTAASSRRCSARTTR